MNARDHGRRPSLVRGLVALVLGLWPVAAVAGVPVLPRLPTTGTAAQISQGPTPAAIVAAAGNDGSVPVQRPQGMALESAPIPVPPRITTPAPGAPAVGPAPAPVARPSAVAPADPRPETPALPEAADERPEDPSPDVGLAARQTARERFPHGGFVTDFRLGTQGCIGRFCRAGGHDVRPGVRLGGFIGGNVRGWFEAGLGGGWGTMRPQITPGTNALVLYGLDPGVLQQALLAQAAGRLRVDLAGMAVRDAEIRSAQIGPSVRVHLLPRGRIDAFVGSGVGYNLLRTRYRTAAGDVDLDFHGIEVPVEANLSVYVHRNVAVGLQFDYMWTWYGVAVLDHPQQRAALPLSVLQGAAQQQGIDLRAELPQLWTLGLALRGRL